MVDKIKEFISKDLHDAQLPIDRHATQQGAADEHHDAAVELICKWEPHLADAFLDMYQWQFLSPVFECQVDGSAINLHKNMRLPWVQEGPDPRNKIGHVRQVEMHPAHFHGDRSIVSDSHRSGLDATMC